MRGILILGVIFFFAVIGSSCATTNCATYDRFTKNTDVNMQKPKNTYQTNTFGGGF